MVKNQVEILNNIKTFENVKYWYGAKGELASIELAKRLKAENPKVWTNTYYSRALQDIDGKTRVCDCSGMVCACYDISNIGSYVINETFSKTKKIKNGMILWRKGHVGIYANGKVYQMKSQAKDFFIENYNAKEWSNILYSEKIDYDYAYDKGWHLDKKGYWYAYGNHQGEFHKDTIQSINNHYFYFDKDGYIKTGWFNVNDEWYYSDENGLWGQSPNNEFALNLIDKRNKER